MFKLISKLQDKNKPALNLKHTKIQLPGILYRRPFRVLLGEVVFLNADLPGPESLVKLMFYFRITLPTVPSKILSSLDANTTILIPTLQETEVGKLIDLLRATQEIAGPRFNSDSLCI